MNATLVSLLVLYLALIAFNVVLAALLWRRERSANNRNLLLTWIGTLLALFAQMALSQNDQQLTLAAATSCLNAFPVARFAAQMRSRSIQWRWYLVALLGTVAGGLVLQSRGAPFWVSTLPITMAAAGPMMIESVSGLMSQSASTTTTARLFYIACLAQGAHFMDYGFLRPRPEFAPIGFTIAIAIVFALSITSTGVALEQTANAKARAEEESALRTRLFQNLSHELRTPLTLILAPLDALLGNPEIALTDHMRQQIQSVRRSAARLMQLTHGMLDLAKAEAGKTFLRYEQTSLRNLLEPLLAPFEQLAKARAITWRFTAEEAEEVVVDREKVEIVVINLVGNAFKFTPPKGAVTVHLRQEEKFAVIEVKDAGVGIEPADLEVIFERFKQAQQRVTRSGGTGIGLSLVKELVTLHRGEVRVASEVGRGSTFTVLLPRGTAHVREELRDRRVVDIPVATERRESARDQLLALATAQLEPLPNLGAEPPQPSVGPRILIVEDNPELRQFLRRLVGQEYRTLEASDGREGLERTRSESPSLVLSDVMMPNLSGFELVKALKSDAKTRQIPVILLTARRGGDPAVEGFDAGADDFVNKPFHPRELMARIRAHLTMSELGRQLAQAQKTTLLGTLSAGLAHEVRNPLNAIMNGLPIIQELAGRSAAPDDAASIKKLIDIAVAASARILGLVQDLQDFSNIDRAQVRPWRADEALETTVRLMSHRLGDVTIEREFGRLAPFEGNPTQLNQVLMNLVDNAARAMAEGGGRRKLGLGVRDEDGGLGITISDCGLGIEPERLPRIFDPFYTTRQPGDGTGLGLHICRQIVENHGGRITAESQLGRGTTVRVWLPRGPVRPPLPLGPAGFESATKRF